MCMGLRADAPGVTSPAPAHGTGTPCMPDSWHQVEAQVPAGVRHGPLSPGGGQSSPLVIPTWRVTRASFGLPAGVGNEGQFSRGSDV